MTTPTGTIFKIQKYALHDGPGIRTAVFLKGCPLTCAWCHNPEGQSFAPQVMTAVRETASAVTIGKTVSVARLLAEIEKERIFYDESGGGVTFSGGEPLGQPGFLLAMLRACAEREIHTVLDTSGHAPLAELVAAAGLADRILYDLKLMDERAHQRYTGVSNQRLLSNLEAIAAMGDRIVIRLAAIPGITDTDENLHAMTTFLRNLGTFRRIDVLPYHDSGGDKYRRLGMTYALAHLQPHTKARLTFICRHFERAGFETRLGGSP